MLYIGYTTHSNKHKHNINEYKCGDPKLEIYIEDVYATISGEVDNIWKNIEKYIAKINKYYINNLLVNNLAKMKIMIISNKQDIKSKHIKLEDKLIGHSKTIKILGTTLNDELT